MTGIEELLRAAPIDRDNVLLWLPTRYYIPESFLCRPGWLSRFLDKTIELHRLRGRYDTLYEPIDAAHTVIDKVIRSAIPQIPVANSQGEAASLAAELDSLREDAAASSALAHSAALQQGQLQEQIGALSSELESYRTGVLSSLFHWARGWANTRLPLGSRRRNVARALANALVVLVSRGPGGLLRALRRRSPNQDPLGESREVGS